MKVVLLSLLMTLVWIRPLNASKQGLQHKPDIIQFIYKYLEPTDWQEGLCVNQAWHMRLQAVMKTILSHQFHQFKITPTFFVTDVRTLLTYPAFVTTSNNNSPRPTRPTPMTIGGTECWLPSILVFTSSDNEPVHVEYISTWNILSTNDKLVGTTQTKIGENFMRVSLKYSRAGTITQITISNEGRAYTMFSVDNIKEKTPNPLYRRFNVHARCPCPLKSLIFGSFGVYAFIHTHR